MTFDQFLRYEADDDACVIRVLRACEDGHISPIGRAPRPVGIGSLVFEASTLRQYRFSGQDDQLVMLPEVAHRLRIKQEVVYSLVRLSLLPVVSVRKGRRIVQVCTTAGLAEFRTRYVFARDLAETLRTSPRSIIHRLTEMGVMPAAGREDDGCRQCLYRRETLIGFGLQCVDSGGS